MFKGNPNSTNIEAFHSDIGDIAEEENFDGYDNDNASNENDEYDDNIESDEEQIVDTNPIMIGICAMAKKVNSKPMEEILTRLQNYGLFNLVTFDQDMIINKPVEEWPHCDCLVSFYSKDFPLHKAEEYARVHQPFLINNLAKQWLLMDRIRVYEILKEAGIEQPRYVIKHSNDNVKIIEQDDQIEINGQVFTKPFVEKPVNADDHNIYIYFPSSVGGGSQRLFRKVGSRSSTYSSENRIRRNGSFIYEEFMPTDGTDVKVYTVGSEYAHAEARKSPALDGVVERDECGKEIRYPVILRTEEKIIAKKIVLAFQQNVCGFDLLRAYGKSYVCDVNGFSFVKNSTKYYDDCALILSDMIIKHLAPQRHIPLPLSYEAENRPVVITSYGTMMELRCVIAVIRHGDRTPKQKMKMEVKNALFFKLFKKYDGMKNGGRLKLKKPSQLQEVLDVARNLIEECTKLNVETLETKETKTKLLQLKSVLEMYGHFSGINRKVQFKYQPYGKPKNSSSEEDTIERDTSPSLLLILKWGGELTEHGKKMAEDLGEAFRKLYPGGEGNKHPKHRGFLRLHSTYRHDLKIYASDEGRVQTTAAAFAKGLLALDGELPPILMQMVKSANTNGLLDNDSVSDDYQNEVKSKLRDYMCIDRDFTPQDFERLAPTKNDSLIAALNFIKNPMEMCKKVYGYIKELTNLIRNKITERKNYYEIKLYHSETWELMLRRWSKLEKDFYNKKKEKFEISKIPDIYDCIKYDLMHNNNILNFEHAIELYTCSKALADYTIPQEYGITEDEKLRIAQSIIAPLLQKIRIDLKSNLTGIWNCENESVIQLDPTYSKGIQTPGRHVRTRLYFTSESHVYSLFNILRYGKLLDFDNEQWLRAKEYMNKVPELNYLTQIVIMLYEDTSVHPDSDKRFHVELHFSSGADDSFNDKLNKESDAAKAASEPPLATLNDPLVEVKPIKIEVTAKFDQEASAVLTTEKSKKSDTPSSSSKFKSKPQATRHHPEKKSNVSWMKKHFRTFFNVKPLPEHNTTPVEINKQNVESETSESQVELDNLKPRSFEDDRPYVTVDVKSVKVGSVDSTSYFNHYNTFHGSATPSNYAPIQTLFSPRFSLGTNSSPDLNQKKFLNRSRKASVIQQELIKVRSIRPLETLHNNLCFNTLNKFFSSMILNNSIAENDESDFAVSATNFSAEKLLRMDLHDQINASERKIVEIVNSSDSLSQTSIISSNVQHQASSSSLSSSSSKSRFIQLKSEIANNDITIDKNEDTKFKPS